MSKIVIFASTVENEGTWRTWCSRGSLREPIDQFSRHVLQDTLSLYMIYTRSTIHQSYTKLRMLFSLNFSSVCPVGAYAWMIHISVKFSDKLRCRYWQHDKFAPLFGISFIGFLNTKPIRRKISVWPKITVENWSRSFQSIAGKRLRLAFEATVFLLMFCFFKNDFLVLQKQHFYTVNRSFSVMSPSRCAWYSFISSRP